MVAPLSPASSDGMVTNFDNSGNQFGMDIGGMGRKRIIDGPVERVVERRQRRMIKNRESAARSRARKQVPLFWIFFTNVFMEHAFRLK
jgi:ABA responsive element binding factor